MLGEKLRLTDPVLTHVKSEATPGAVTGSLEKISSGITRAVENGASLKPVRQYVLYELDNSVLRRDHLVSYSEWIRFRRIFFTGADARSDLDILVPWCEPLNFGPEFFGVHARKLSLLL